ncbi:SRPBCC family protein [Chloroflexota bacterium]
MARIDKEITVNASIDRVFKYISVPSKWLEFWPSLVKIEDVQSLPNGGYRAKYDYKMLGMHYRGTGEYTEFSPNQLIVVQTKGSIKSTIMITTHSTEDKTRITLMIEYGIPVTLLGKLTEFVILKMNESEADLVMRNLQIRFLQPY